MCGLFGFISLNAHRKNGLFAEKKTFTRQMMYLSALRGIDSTGIAMADMLKGDPEDILVYKRALASPDFLCQPTTEKLMNLVDESKVVLGHTRSKTMGSITDKEAHPFHYGHIAMIHNGTVSNYKSLVNDCDVSTDSAHIAKSMAENGAKETLEKLIGAYCVAWYDAKERTFNIARNKERPLYWIDVPSWDGLVFGSEMGMLAWVLDRANVQTEGAFTYPVEYKIYTWKTDDTAKLEYTTLPFVEAKHRATPSRSAATTSAGTTQTSGVRGTHQGTGKGADTTTPIGKTKESSKSIRKAEEKLKPYGIRRSQFYAGKITQFQAYPKNKGLLGAARIGLLGVLAGKSAMIHNLTKKDYDYLATLTHVLGRIVNVKRENKNPLFIMEINHENQPHWEESEEKRSGECFKGPSGHYFTRSKWLELTEDGCCICGDPISIDDAPKVKWVGPNQQHPCCAQCTEQDILKTLGINDLNDSDSEEMRQKRLN